MWMEKKYERILEGMHMQYEKAKTEPSEDLKEHKISWRELVAMLLAALSVFLPAILILIFWVVVIF